ncbi:MAG: hypothetical protein ABIO85_09610 [Sphingomicrobium sp.]
MLRLMTTALIATAALAAPALASAHPVTFERDGAHYSYTTQLTPAGAVVIRGQQLDTAESFNLVVDTRGHVDGTVGGSTVSFMVPKANRDAIVADLGKPALDAKLAAIK